MAEKKPVHLPDLGTDDAVEVIEISVAVGDQVEQEDTLLTLESEKASMDVPAPFSGKVSSLKVKVGDKVKTGDLILELQTSDTVDNNKEENTQTNSDSNESNKSKESVDSQELQKQSKSKAEQPAQDKASQLYSIVVPDIGTEDAVTIIEMNITKGDELTQDTVLLTLESEKASMDLPSPVAGKVADVKVSVNDQVKQGDVIATVLLSDSAATKKDTAELEQTKTDNNSVNTQASLEQQDTKQVEHLESKQAVQSEPNTDEAFVENESDVYASPAVRRLCREFGVNLNKVTGTGRKQRVLAIDVKNYVKHQLNNTQQPVGSGSSTLFSMPEVDFSKFGKISEQELPRIKKISAQNLHRNWVNIPHVTQFDEADITDMEAFRQAHKDEVAKKGYKLTPIVFLMKAVVAALKEFPLFNTSLSACGSKLIQKYYYNIGVAVDTPHGLMVPVIKEVDQKGLFTLAQELSSISQQARDMKIKANQMKGSCFTISSLGGIGGTGFTPIINAPDVAILGVSKSQMKPVFIKKEFQPRLLLPLALSYDHRVIDGAQAARFVAFLASRLQDLRCLLL